MSLTPWLLDQSRPWLQAAVLACLGGFFYTHVGYPLLMAALAALARSRLGRLLGWTPAVVAPTAVWPRLSLIIAAFNEERCLEEKLRNALTLDYPSGRLQIIVAADGSSDGTADIARRHADRGVITLHSPERRGKSAAISRAAAAASGEILVFSDANAFYAPDALRRLAARFRDPTVGGVGGRKTVCADHGVGASEGVYWRYESRLKGWESATGSTVTMVGEMMALRRELFAPIPPRIINDDAWLSCLVLKQGARLLYEPAAVCREKSCACTADEVLRRRRMNAGRWQLLLAPAAWPWRSPLSLFKLVSHKFLRLLLPFFMLGALAADLLLAASQALGGEVWPLHRLTLPLQLTAWLLALAGGLAERYGLGRTGWRRLPALAWYLTRSSLTPLSGLASLLVGRQTSVWTKAPRPVGASADPFAARPSARAVDWNRPAEAGLAVVRADPGPAPSSQASDAAGATAPLSPVLTAARRSAPSTDPQRPEFS